MRLVVSDVQCGQGSKSAVPRENFGNDAVYLGWKNGLLNNMAVSDAQRSPNSQTTSRLTMIVREAKAPTPTSTSASLCVSSVIVRRLVLRRRGHGMPNGVSLPLNASIPFHRVDRMSTEKGADA